MLKKPEEDGNESSKKVRNIVLLQPCTVFTESHVPAAHGVEEEMSMMSEEMEKRPKKKGRRKDYMESSNCIEDPAKRVLKFQLSISHRSYH